MNKIKSLILILTLVLGINIYASAPTVYNCVNATTVQAPAQKTYTVVNPLDVVARPNFYLNKNIKIKAKFDKFSTLGLDYKPEIGRASCRERV